MCSRLYDQPNTLSLNFTALRMLQAPAINCCEIWRVMGAHVDMMSPYDWIANMRPNSSCASPGAISQRPWSYENTMK